MLLLVSSPTGAARRYWGHPHLGWLVTPRNLATLPQLLASDLPYAADNDCFQGLHEARYLRMLDALATARRRPLFVVVPDVVGDALATLDLWHTWLPALRARNLPPAFALQDGQDAASVPWVDCAAVFVGGSTHFKETAGPLIQAARRRGVWCHAGRVCTLRRARLMDAIGPVDSFDCSIFSKQPDKFIPWMLRGLHYQQTGSEVLCS